MSNEEVTKIITEYMGGMVLEGVISFPELRPLNLKPLGFYTNSLDALVPVWEKLQARPMFEYDHSPLQNKMMEFCEVSDNSDGELPYGYGSGKTIQEAAAHATAKAIKSLK